MLYRSIQEFIINLTVPSRILYCPIHKFWILCCSILGTWLFHPEIQDTSLSHPEIELPPGFSVFLLLMKASHNKVLPTRPPQSPQHQRQCFARLCGLSTATSTVPRTHYPVSGCLTRPWNKPLLLFQGHITLCQAVSLVFGTVINKATERETVAQEGCEVLPHISFKCNVSSHLPKHAHV